MSDLAVETHGLRKRFGRKLAVADLSLSVRQGEVFGFLGPNGAGKTTSLKMLLGLVAPSAGRAALLGAPVGDRRARAGVGFLPEHFRFQDWLTGREILRFHGRLFGLHGRALHARADALLERVRLTEAADRKLREYSKGMLQRVGLALALVNEPRLVFLDEPTSGLDPIGRLLVRDVIRELRERGVTVFLNSHLLGEVEVTCDRVTFIKGGRTLREMTLGEETAGVEVELRVGPLDAETAAGLARFGRLLSPAAGAANESAAALAAGPGATGWHRLKVADDAALPEIARWLVGRGVALHELRTVRRSLEALFLEIMGDDQAPG
ncbi:MAG: ABC transporter ATP-binding protein [Candidatus Eisenbacteria bacterium]|uniref:ABC transporter ATP-binding protein n=1 Tax=Eiseniibacteriota bacterium TaxID=2212470 RepID=A0A538UDA7_UNCEI|nr:MAG: ABC transporter ATP-binding protein [Candidatus Eisenbacteria bacterium]